MADSESESERGSDSCTDFAALADAGWPSLEREQVGGWIARFSLGVTRRANSVIATGPVEDADAAITAVERLYRDRGLPPVFQLADADAALEKTLLARGYVAASETLVLSAETVTVAQHLSRPAAAAEAVVIHATPDEDWLDVWWTVDGRGGDAERAIARDILIGGPALYATVRDERGTASVGRLALVEQQGARWGGLYAIATRADARRRGHALAVIGALAAAASTRHVTDLWLQVLASNQAALSLYRRLGFSRVATYRYLAPRP